MYHWIIIIVHVGCILARNFQLPNNFSESDDDEVAVNIDDYVSVDESENFEDEVKSEDNENSTSQNSTNSLQFIRELKNITRTAGETVKLTCEVLKEPLLVEIKWFKNDLPIIIKQKSRISEKNTIGKQKASLISRLKITNLEVHDSGFYKCTAKSKNNVISKSSTGILNVEQNHWKKNSESRDLPDFEPSIPNFQTILKSPSINLINKNFNINSNMGANAAPPNFSVGPIYPYPICEPYRGTYCKKYLSEGNVYIPANVSQVLLESKISDAVKVINHSDDLSKSCEMFAIPALCHFALPHCKLSKTPAPEFICQQDCKIIEDDICKMEYAIAKRHNLIGKKFEIPNCAGLSSFDCRNLGLPQPEPLNRNDRCYWGDGSKYRGSVDETESGKKCIPWNQARRITIDTPELIGGHNYCRNPGQERKRPWCYTTDKKEEPCSIPECMNDLSLQNTLMAICGLAAFLFFVICYVCCSRRRARRKKREQMISNKFKMSPGKTNIVKMKPGSDCNVGSSKLEMSSLIPTSTNSSQKSERRPVKVFEFDFSTIKFEEELGEGAFGKVYKGEVITSNGDRMMVAIKTLKENANSKTVGEFKREVELMSELRHPNIISLLGVCMSKRLCMLFEFMSCGDLHEYLIAHSPNQDVPRNNMEPILEQEDLLNIAIQIAAGMEYLCNQHFVHRDLATRNCLVGHNLMVKISDFGLSRDVYSSDYYRVQKSALLPIRWMSPESILYGKFTVESDIWSFGVVLWEIYSYGLQPYYAHNNQDVVNMIRSHQVLSSPEGCPPRMYALMIECWNQVPSRRPQFAEIHSRLIQWRDTCSSSDKTDSTQLSHNPHKVQQIQHHHHHHGYSASLHGMMIK